MANETHNFRCLTNPLFSASTITCANFAPPAQLKKKAEEAAAAKQDAAAAAAAEKERKAEAKVKAEEKKAEARTNDGETQSAHFLSASLLGADGALGKEAACTSSSMPIRRDCIVQYGMCLKFSVLSTPADIGATEGRVHFGGDDAQPQSTL